jgi:hypothetical protein
VNCNNRIMKLPTPFVFAASSPAIHFCFLHKAKNCSIFGLYLRKIVFTYHMPLISSNIFRQLCFFSEPFPCRAGLSYTEANKKKPDLKSDLKLSHLCTKIA